MELPIGTSIALRAASRVKLLAEVIPSRTLERTFAMSTPTGFGLCRFALPLASPLGALALGSTLPHASIRNRRRWISGTRRMSSNIRVLGINRHGRPYPTAVALR